MWLPLALMAALFSAVAETVRKRLMRELDPFAAAFLTAGFSAVILLPVVLWEGVPGPTGRFWLALAISGGINAVAAVLVSRAYQVSDLSLVSPLTGTTPMFTLLAAAVVLAEIPSVAGLLGVVTITAGTYLLATSRAADSVAAPLRALWSDRGARLMLLVALLYGISSTFDKVGVLASTAIFWGLALQTVTSVAAGVRVLGTEKGREGLAGMPLRLWLLAAATGAATAAMMVAQMTALTVGFAGYVIAVKRISILLTVLAGGLLFRERNLLLRLGGAAVILAGLVLLAVG